ncbi:hypothetical protein [Cohnella sp. GCM10012308]|uniref:hypothetical protein n=1 Tax=Cohnella sp. GCM10012308 TaxID=3317329 RepID=UPI00360E6F16
MMDGDAGIFPIDKDYQAWLEVRMTPDETEQMERMAFYWKGRADCYAYLKKMGAF